MSININSFFRIILLITVLLVVGGVSVEAGTYDPYEEIYLEEIELRGLNLWADQDVEVLVEASGLVEGDTYTVRELEARADEAVSALVVEGLFADVITRLQNGRLIFELYENPRLGEINFEGNVEVTDEELEGVLLLQPGEPASEHEISSARRELSQFLRMQGFDRSAVEVSVQEAEGIVNVQFLIDEGTQRLITSVHFDFEEINLLQRIHRVWGIGWENPLREGMPYSPQHIQMGMEAIRNWYHNRGYMDVQIEPRIFYNRREQGYDVMFYMREGPVYSFGEIEILDNEVFDDEELLQKVPLSSGDIFREDRLREGLQAIEDHYQSQGYIEARALDPGQFQIERDREAGVVNVRARVYEGRPFYVERIEIHGNEQTYERVIRREIRLREGDLLKGERIRDSRRRLFNLGFFRDVQMDLLPGTQEDKKVLRVQVAEGRTGHLEFGGGYSSATGFTGQLRLEKDNFSLYDWDQGFTGRGESLEASMNMGQREDSYRLSWRDPWINDSVDSDKSPPMVPISFGFTGFQQIYRRDEGYDRFDRGGSVRMGREFGPALSNQIDAEYSFRSVEVRDLDEVDADDIPRDFKEEAAGDSEFKRQISSIKVGLQRDRRNVRRFPTEGYYVRGSALLATDYIGGNSNYYEPELDYRHYIPFVGPTFWAVRANYRTLDSWEDKEDNPIPSFERYRLGGFRDVRAYGFRDIMIYDNGERDRGGNSAFFTNLELRSEMIENTMQLFIFADAGDVYESSWGFSASDLKRSYGTGFRIQSPMGPMIFSWGRKLDDTYPGADDAGESRVDFTIGTGF